jgi:hypothetical protein
MQIKDPGWFSRGSVMLPSNPAVTPDSLVAELQQAWGPRGYEVYKTALVGADVVLKKSGWTGLALKIKHGAQGTEILFNAFSPSVLVRLFATGLITVLILQRGPWKQLLEEWKQFAQQSPLFLGQLPGGAAPQLGQPAA